MKTLKKQWILQQDKPPDEQKPTLKMGEARVHKPILGIAWDSKSKNQQVFQKPFNKMNF